MMMPFHTFNWSVPNKPFAYNFRKDTLYVKVNAEMRSRLRWTARLRCKRRSWRDFERFTHPGLTRKTLERRGPSSQET